MIFTALFYQGKEPLENGTGKFSFFASVDLLLERNNGLLLITHQFFVKLIVPPPMLGEHFKHNYTHMRCFVSGKNGGEKRILPFLEKTKTENSIV